MKELNNGDRAVFIRDNEECTVLLCSKHCNVCKVLFDDGIEDFVNVDELELYEVQSAEIRQ